MSSTAKTCVGFFILLGVTAVLQAAPPRPKPKPGAPASTATVTAADLRELREALAAQKAEIEALRAQVERLMAGKEEAMSEPREVAQPVAFRAQDPAAAPLVKPEKQSVAPLEAGWNGEHVFLRTADGRFDVEPTGFLQLDYRGYSGTSTPADTFAIRRGRFGFQGKLDKRFQFTVLADFADRNSTLLREGSVEILAAPAIQFKFGQFKEPFSQEELVSAQYLDFVERSLVVNFVPAYSPGMMVHGDFLGGAVQYQAGAFNGRSFLKLADTSTPEGVLRLRFTPWRSSGKKWLEQLSFGGATTGGRTQNATSFVGVMPTNSFAFFPSEAVNGNDNRANGELTWIVGPAALRAEYAQTNQSREGLGKNGTKLPGVVGKAYYVTATYLLTGETRPENGQPMPRASLLGEGPRGLGAWELKFRYSNQQMDDRTHSNRADQFSTGLNWYPTYFVRSMLDFNIERLKQPVTAPAPLSPQTFLSVLTRIQFRF